MATYILTVIGDDRSGLVSALAGVVTAHGASWERSQLSRLAGKFAGVVLVTVPEGRLEGLVGELEGLGSQGLRVSVEPTEAPATSTLQRLHLNLLGADRPGIVAEISASLAAHGVSIEEFATDVREAPMAGGTLFEARAVLVAPPGASTDALRGLLEGLADELMVEINVFDEE